MSGCWCYILYVYTIWIQIKPRLSRVFSLIMVWPLRLVSSSAKLCLAKSNSVLFMAATQHSSNIVHFHCSTLLCDWERYTCAWPVCKINCWHCLTSRDLFSGPSPGIKQLRTVWTVQVKLRVYTCPWCCTTAYAAALTSMHTNQVSQVTNSAADNIIKYSGTDRNVNLAHPICCPDSKAGDWTRLCYAFCSLTTSALKLQLATKMHCL